MKIRPVSLCSLSFSVSLFFPLSCVSTAGFPYGSGEIGVIGTRPFLGVLLDSPSVPSSAFSASPTYLLFLRLRLRLRLRLL